MFVYLFGSIAKKKGAEKTWNWCYERLLLLSNHHGVSKKNIVPEHFFSRCVCPRSGCTNNSSNLLIIHWKRGVRERNDPNGSTVNSCHVTCDVCKKMMTSSQSSRTKMEPEKGVKVTFSKIFQLTSCFAVSTPTDH